MRRALLVVAVLTSMAPDLSALAGGATPGLESETRSPDPGEALDPAWRNWAYSRRIEVGDDARTQRLVRLQVPEEVFDRSNPRLTDLRIIDDNGKEAGYALHARDSSSRHERRIWFRTELLDTGHVPGSYAQAVADTANDGRAHDMVVIELADRRGEFFAWAEIASSPDYETWRVLRTRAPVYHFRATREQEAMRVSYPPTRDRWLRVRLERDGESVSIAGLRVGKCRAEAGELERANLELLLRDDSPENQSWWESRSDRQGAPIAGVRIQTSREEFHRPLKVSVSNDGRVWDEVGRGQVYRFLPRDAEAGTVRESLEVEFAAEAARAWRVAVIDGNDAPIEGLRIELLRPIRSVVFRPEPGRAFRLIYGNPRAEAPEYELAELLDHRQRQQAPLGALGAEQRNLTFVSSEPFSERHPALLWAALAAAVLVLGGLAIRALRSDPRLN